jgi:GNAT superfamily N-acetyltransferase
MDVSRDGLVLELLFDGDARDSSGRGHCAVVHGATPTVDRFGRTGALLFRGPEDHVAVSPPPALTGRALTVSAWVRVDTGRLQGWSQCFIAQDNGDDADRSRRIFQLSVLNGHVVWHRMTCVRDPTSRRFIVPGVWCHVAAVVNGDLHRLYVDGELQDSIRDAMRAHGDEPIYIGRKGTEEPYFFVRGAIDDVRMFNRALDASEVDALYCERGYVGPLSGYRAAPLSGMWGPDGEALLDLRFDGQSHVAGAIVAGERGNLAPIARGTFDANTRLLKLEGRARAPGRDVDVDYSIEGGLRGRRMHLHYRFAEVEGDVVLTDVNRGRTWRRARQEAARRIGRWIEPLRIPIDRWRRARLRPTKAENLRRLQSRSERIDDLVFRDAGVDDIPALSVLHAKTWAATYPNVRRPPTAQLRERQWREAFAKNAGREFVIVIENGRGELIGFARGIRTGTSNGDLNKIYLLSEYQRMGVGRRLVGHVARRFLRDGIATMTLSADPGNPSCRFYEALGAEHQIDESGRPSPSAFIWRDLEALARICPIA